MGKVVNRAQEKGFKYTSALDMSATKFTGAAQSQAHPFFLSPRFFLCVWEDSFFNELRSILCFSGCSPRMCLGTYSLVRQMFARTGEKKRPEYVGPNGRESWTGTPGGGVGRGIGLVPGYTTLSVRVWANINSVP